MNFKRFTLQLIALGQSALMAATLFAASASAATPTLILDRKVNGASIAMKAAANSVPQADKAIRRQRPVELDFAAMAEIRRSLADDAQSQLVSLTFFGDLAVQVEFNRVEATQSGGFALIGRVAGDQQGIAVLVQNPGATSLHVSTGDKRLTVTGTPSKGFMASELAPVALPDHDRLPPEFAFPSSKQPPVKGQLAIAPAEVAADSGTTMDVMVIYTNTARIQHGGTAQMHAAIDAQVALTNQAYLDSGVVQRLRLVYKGEVTHTESTSDVDLNRIIDPADGVLDEIPILRDLYAADFVSLWGNYPDTCGLGSLMSSESSAFASRAYNVVNSPACTNGNGTTFAHELGHNMGLRHDPFVDPNNTTVTPSTGGGAVSVGYAHGYVDLTNRFRTVMSYADRCTAQGINCQRIARFSNPALTFNNTGFYASASPSAPSGDAATGHEQRALDDTRETTANFRQGLASFTGPGIIVFLPTSYSVKEGNGSVTLRVGRHVGSSGNISVNYATANGTATAGNDYVATSGSLIWLDGDTSDKFITVNVIQDTLLEGRETFTVTLSSPAGGASIGSAGGVSQVATVSIIDDDPDTFPPGGVVPSTYSQATPAAPWDVDLNDGYQSPTSLRSAQIYTPTQGSSVYSSLQFSGNFIAGTITFAYKVSSYSQTFGNLEFIVDGVTVLSSAGGETGWLTFSQPVTAGAHTLTWRHRQSLNFPCANAVPAAPGGSNCADRSWIDQVFLPLAGNTLSVLKGGTGTGTVNGMGIACGADCVETLPAGSMVTLSAVPAGNSAFAGWIGSGCSGTGTCTVTLNSSQSVTAMFNLLPEVFPANCSLPTGWVNNPAGSTTGWSVATDRVRTGTCSLKSNTMADSAGSGQFNRARIEYTGDFQPGGNVSFYYNVSSETGWDCFQFLINDVRQGTSGSCNYTPGTGASGDTNTWVQVTYPVSGPTKLTWSYDKDYVGIGGMDAVWIDDVVIPPLQPVTLTVARNGTGTGTVTGTGITCGVDCSEPVQPGTVISLTATPDAGSAFTGWSGGGCSGVGTCMVTVNSNTTVTATFTLQQSMLGITKSGTGMGTVTSNVGGINCGATCSAAINNGNMVTLTAVPTTGSMFAGWSGGGCSGTGTCVVTVSMATTVDAAFNLVTAPGAPTFNSITAGNTQATAYFSAPGSDGGAPITQYTVQCPDAAAVQPTRFNTGAGSPITVTGMVNGVTYNCRVIASNSVGPGPTSNQMSVTPVAAPPITLVSVDSRKTHGGVTKYKVPIALGAPLAGAITVEPRSASSHEIVFTFDAAVTSVTSVAVSTGNASIGFSGAEVSVTLSNVPDNQRVAITVNGVNGVTSATANVGFLVGDVSNSRSVSVVDIAAVKARSGTNVTTDATARFDVLTNGTIGGPDLAVVKARSGTTLVP